jgi:hypothetical protein
VFVLGSTFFIGLYFIASSLSFYAVGDLFFYRMSTFDQYMSAALTDPINSLTLMANVDIPIVMEMLRNVAAANIFFGLLCVIFSLKFPIPARYNSGMYSPRPQSKPVRTDFDWKTFFSVHRSLVPILANYKRTYLSRIKQSLKLFVGGYLFGGFLMAIAFYAATYTIDADVSIALENSLLDPIGSLNDFSIQFKEQIMSISSNTISLCLSFGFSLAMFSWITDDIK